MRDHLGNAYRVVTGQEACQRTRGRSAQSIPQVDQGNEHVALDNDPEITLTPVEVKTPKDAGL